MSRYLRPHRPSRRKRKAPSALAARKGSCRSCLVSCPMPHLLISNASCPMPHSSPKSDAPGPARAPPRPRPRRRASTGPKNPNAAERKVCHLGFAGARLHQRGPRSERRSETTWIATEPEVRGQAAAFWQTKRRRKRLETTPEAAATNAAATIGSSLSFKSASNGPDRPPPEEAGRWRGRVPVLWPQVLRAHAAVLGTCQSTRARRPIASKSW